MFRWGRRLALSATTHVVAMLTMFIGIAAPSAQQKPATWEFMQDGVVFAEFNRQGGPAGGKEFVAPNWWMGMAARSLGGGPLTFTAMFSLDPATVGRSGYREIFQAGETLDGVPVVDRQHPHDLFMQLAASWRIPIGSTTGFTIAGGPVGEPALGPVAFMHRPSAAENPLAPLSHHVFDSTHVSFGVVTVAVDHGPWLIEGSVFNGREPDERRWDFDFGALDSVSGRVWYRPNGRWEFQASTGRLTSPEVLEPGNVQRTTVSGAWFSRDGDNYTAISGGYGVNAENLGHRQAVFGELTKHLDSYSFYSRTEIVQVETALLRRDDGVDERRRDLVAAFTFGAVRDVLRRRGFEGGLGGAVTFYGVPDLLVSTHGEHPVSFQLFFRLRPPASGGMGRMWNMRMSQPMGVVHR